MAEKWSEAFGRYLRTLRERRGLSLQDVTSLSQPFAETITKGYLSRCENGRVRLALSKVPALGHIYKVSAEVLLERIDLDMELARVGAPDTTGMGREELRAAGKHAADSGYKWVAYGYRRDCVTRATAEPVGNAYRDRTEQVACAALGCATAALALGRMRFALHECRHVEANNEVGPRYMPLLLHRLSTTHRYLGELEQARHYAEKAIEGAQMHEGRQYLGYALSARAHQAFVESDLKTAASFFHKCHDVFKKDGLVAERATALSNLAQVFFDLGRFWAARRALMASEAVLGSSSDYRRHHALVRLLLGEIDALENKDDLAEKHWKEAACIARELNDRVLQFKTDYQLFKQAQRRGNLPAARSIHRRLSKLSNYVPETTPELRDFRELVLHAS